MKKVKFIFATVETAALYGVGYLACTKCDWYIATLIILFSLLAVVMQKEYSDEDWMNYVNEEE